MGKPQRQGVFCFFVKSLNRGQQTAFDSVLFHFSIIWVCFFFFSLQSPSFHKTRHTLTTPPLTPGANRGGGASRFPLLQHRDPHAYRAASLGSESTAGAGHRARLGDGGAGPGGLSGGGRRAAKRGPEGLKAPRSAGGRGASPRAPADATETPRTPEGSPDPPERRRAPAPQPSSARPPRHGRAPGAGSLPARSGPAPRRPGHLGPAAASPWPQPRRPARPSLSP